MLVAHSFDLWQKDTFFSAAEEVQQSADIMESAYRTWLRARKEGVTAQILDALSRELQMALGTAKWQLEEFERAVRLSYRNHADEVTKTRHRQFVSVIEDQISRVEATLKESYTVDRNQPFSWVNLDEEERDDLALFLSGTSDTPRTKFGEPATSPFKEKSNTRKDDRLDSKVGSKAQIPIKTKGFEEIVTSDVEASCFIEPEEKEIPETRDEPSSRRARNLPGVSALEIIIDSDNEQRNALVEATPKEKDDQLHESAVQTNSEKSEATADFTSIAFQFHTFHTCFDANHFLSCAFPVLFSLSSCDILLLVNKRKGCGFCIDDGEIF
ncbi:Syntaxin [Abeliophyllum distichum]|uniref:Syntaxin n=1 Tax=Abeliophyllum distichum TaxID=126358 RepID=A0ABD1R026_9LAMI